VKKNLITSMLMTIATTLLLGIAYPLMVTALAQGLFHDQANGQLLVKDGKLLGSRIIGQPFVSEQYFHSRPSAAGAGYDGANSGASNLGPTNHTLIERVAASVAQLKAEDPRVAVPIDLVTTSGSGLDPDITPAAAEFQIPRVAKARDMTETEVRALVVKHTEKRQLGFLGEARVNVLELNLDLDSVTRRKTQQAESLR
jgi:K+-transporting ATPase ATPase C chain